MRRMDTCSLPAAPPAMPRPRASTEERCLGSLPVTVPARLFYCSRERWSLLISLQCVVPSLSFRADLTADQTHAAIGISWHCRDSMLGRHAAGHKHPFHTLAMRVLTERYTVPSPAPLAPDRARTVSKDQRHAASQASAACDQILLRFSAQVAMWKWKQKAAASTVPSCHRRRLCIEAQQHGRKKLSASPATA
jgi:hypothetical protein